jgi:hypothetical protein
LARSASELAAWALAVVQWKSASLITTEATAANRAMVPGGALRGSSRWVRAFQPIPMPTAANEAPMATVTRVSKRR